MLQLTYFHQVEDVLRVFFFLKHKNDPDYLWSAKTDSETQHSLDRKQCRYKVTLHLFCVSKTHWFTLWITWGTENSPPPDSLIWNSRKKRPVNRLIHWVCQTFTTNRELDRYLFISQHPWSWRILSLLLSYLNVKSSKSGKMDMKEHFLRNETIHTPVRYIEEK